jgi:dienelactone hydrolase
MFVSVAAADPLPGTAPLAPRDDWDQRILEQAHALLDRKLDEAVAQRGEVWNRDPSTPESYNRSVEPNRARLRRILGVVDQRLPVSMQRWGDDHAPALVAEAGGVRVYQVRWPVVEGIWGEGLLVEPEGKPAAQLVVLPDADRTPEQLLGLADGLPEAARFARRLGCRLIIPQLINRDCRFSGHPPVAMTNQPHREWIYRQAFEMGRHVIGFEVQKALAAVDWFAEGDHGTSPIGVVGHGEGGLIALAAAALDTRVDACLVSGYFDNRRQMWREPIYRNVWCLLNEFGDAELATLVAPRGLVIEYSEVPRVDGPPPVTEGRRDAAAPGVLQTPPPDRVRAEFERIDTLIPADFGRRTLIIGEAVQPVGPISQRAIDAFAAALGVPIDRLPLDGPWVDRRDRFDPVERQRRQVEQMVGHVQRLLRRSDRVRREFFLSQVSLASPEVFAADARAYRDLFRREVIGTLDDPLVPPAARTRLLHDEPGWRGYEVVFDVLPGLQAWGILCVPRDVRPGERRPVVVCQHGLEGVPNDTIADDGRAVRYYKSFAARLAERGFVAYAPFNLYRGGNRFRMLQRKGNPLGLSLFSIITRQHEQLLRWLGGLEFVDADRIAFYGLSYGGKTAMRVPAVLEGYCLSICSGDFNDWIRKNVTILAGTSYMFHGEWEIFEFNLGHTFNYAEMSYLIFPRPFMVERGHHDGCAPDEWVAYEYAKVRWLYDQLGRGDDTRIEFFDGPHRINAEGTFDFLHEKLDWPRPAAE